MTPKQTSETASDNLLDSIQIRSLNAISDAISLSTRATAVELYKSLDKASDWLRADYSIAINLLEANDEWFAARVTASVKDTLLAETSSSEKSTESQTKSASLKSVSLSNLSLVSKDEFEDWLTANVAVKYLEAELGYEINETRLILGFLKRTVYDNKDFPLGPNSIFRSLKASIEALEIPTTPQALIYKLYSRQLLQMLRDFYKSIILAAQKAELAYKPLIAPTHSKPGSSRDTRVNMLGQE